MAPRLPQIRSFDAGQTIRAGIAGEQFRNQQADRNTLIEAGQLAAGGDVAGARDAALAGGQIQTANQFQAMINSADDRQLAKVKRMNDLMSRAAFAAKTPEQWNALVGQLEAAGHTVSDFERNPANRDMIIARGQSLSQMIDNQFKERQLALQEQTQGLRQEKLGLEINALRNPRPSANLTPGEKSADEAFGKDFQEYFAQGGFADTQKQIGQLKNVVQLLRSGQNVSGRIMGRAPNVFRSEASIDAEEQVAEVAQRNLRSILGGQFSEKEGENLIKRAYNPTLDEKINAERLGRLVQQMEVAAAQKEAAAQYFQQNGTLKGFQGRLPSMADFDPGDRNIDATPQQQPDLNFDPLGFFNR